MVPTLKRIKALNGERHAILVDQEGIPLFYPTLWVTVTLRGGSRAVNTIQNALNSIKCLYAWMSANDFNLEERFARGELLQTHEIHSLRDFFQKKFSRTSNNKVSFLSIKPNIVCNSSQYARMSVAAAYLEFLARRIHPTSENYEKRVTAMVIHIKANRPTQNTKTIKSDRNEKYLDDISLDRLGRVDI